MPDGTPQSEWLSIYDEDPPPVELGMNMVIQSIEIPAHRRVISQIDVAEPVRWAPGWIGEKAATRPPPFTRSVIRRGNWSTCSPPTCARIPAPSDGRSEVTPDDVERLEKLERLEREGGQAVK